jgi:hypothetical protein
LSKILTALRLSGPFWIEAADTPKGTLRVLELVALQFCANFLRLSNLGHLCQAAGTLPINMPFAAYRCGSQCRDRTEEAPNLERSFRKHNLRGRLTTLGDAGGK